GAPGNPADPASPEVILATLGVVDCALPQAPSLGAAPVHTGPQFTPPQQPHGPGGGRGGALLVGGIAFAIVFLMIVGLTVAYLVVRTSTSGPRSEEHTSELQSRFDLVC